MVDKINYKGEERIAIILPKETYVSIECGTEFGLSLFDAIETICANDETRALITPQHMLDLVQLARIASNIL